MGYSRGRKGVVVEGGCACIVGARENIFAGKESELI